MESDGRKYAARAKLKAHKEMLERLDVVYSGVLKGMFDRVGSIITTGMAKAESFGLLSDKQLIDISQTINGAHAAMVLHMIQGNGQLFNPLFSPAQIQAARASSVNVPRYHFINDSYKLGILLGQDNPVANKLNFAQLQGMSQPDLSVDEERAMEIANYRAAKHIIGLGNTVDSYTGQILIEADAELLARSKTDIRTQVVEGLARRDTISQVRRNLGEKTADWSRDWGRIAITETTNSLLEAQALRYIETDGPEVMVSRVPAPDACPTCVRLHTDGGVPKVFKMSELAANGTNAGVKGKANYKAVIGPAHPGCVCQMVRVPRGWGWDKETKRLRPPKKARGAA